MIGRIGYDGERQWGMYPATWAEDGRLVIDWEHPTKIYPGAIGPTVILDTVTAVSELSIAESDYPDTDA